MTVMRVLVEEVRMLRSVTTTVALHTMGTILPVISIVAPGDPPAVMKGVAPVKVWVGTPGHISVQEHLQVFSVLMSKG